ncbi:MAG: hypothetical protein ACXVCV_25205 [Polyangia bacterium]
MWWIEDVQRATAAKIDRRVTQDQAATWSVVAQRKDPGSGTDFTTNWYSSQQAYPSHDLTPLSRAADCFTQGADGMPARLARPCPVTDGNPSTKFVPLPTQSCPQGQTCPPVNNWILVDIGFSHPLAFLVLYDVSVSNAAANVIVETSDDLVTWTMAATLPAKPFQTLTMSGAAARFVRLRLSDPNAQWSGSGNGEIAIYAPF